MKISTIIFGLVLVCMTSAKHSKEECNSLKRPEDFDKAIKECEETVKGDDDDTKKAKLYVCARKKVGKISDDYKIEVEPLVELFQSFEGPDGVKEDLIKGIKECGEMEEFKDKMGEDVYLEFAKCGVQKFKEVCQEWN